LIARVVVESFVLDAIREVKRIAPEMSTAALFERKLSRPLPSTRAMIQSALACGANEIALHHTLARTHTIEAAKRSNLRALVWTVDDIKWIKRAYDLKLCALITNYPARMRAALDEICNNQRACS